MAGVSAVPDRSGPPEKFSLPELHVVHAALELYESMTLTERAQARLRCEDALVLSISREIEMCRSAIVGIEALIDARGSVLTARRAASDAGREGREAHAAGR